MAISQTVDVTTRMEDIEIPERDLLSAAEELNLGWRVQNGLRRLRVTSLRDPSVRGRLLSRLERFANGQESVFAWRPYADRAGRDLERARNHLRDWDSECSAKQSDVSFRSFVDVLSRYELEPEVLIDWVRRSTPTDSPRLQRVLRRLVLRVSEARDELASANARLVLHEALKHKPKGMSQNDLFQEGYLGVQKAALRYDPSRGLRFSTYASHWVRQAIRFSYLNKSRIIRVPERAQSELRKKERGDGSTLSAQEADRIQRVMHQTALFSSSDDSTGNMTDRVASTRRGSSLMDEFLEALPDAVERAIGQLADREKCIVRERFGLSGSRRTLEHLGEILRLSRERVRQIEVQILNKLRSDRKLKSLFEALQESNPTLALA